MQHQDGHALLMALTNPAVVAYDPAFAFELSYIIEHGIDLMWGQDKDVMFYITVYNENHPMPPVPEDPSFKEGLLKGLYKFQDAKPGMANTVRLIGSGSIMQSVLQAVPMLEEYGVGAEVWSATSFGELHREALSLDRTSRLNPSKDAEKNWVQKCYEGFDGTTVVATDNQIAFPQLISPWVPGDYVVLGTDGFGRSDTRERLRRFFEVDAESVVAAALSSLSRRGKISPDVAVGAIEKYGLTTGERYDVTTI